MTTVYFIRHSESDHNVTDDRSRPLTEKGTVNCALVTGYLRDKEIDVIVSSPYKRSVDTISEFAESVGLPIITIEDFRERENAWVEDSRVWQSFSEKQWSDFTYKISGGECLAEVQKRNIDALNGVLENYKNMNIVIGTHGTALSTIINHYDKSYGYIDFMNMVNLTPWVAKMTFKDQEIVEIEKVNLFN